MSTTAPKSPEAKHHAAANAAAKLGEKGASFGIFVDTGSDEHGIDEANAVPATHGIAAHSVLGVGFDERIARKP
eukprot:CAMPEP_0119338684 /NCGR_PEP_ID=MMETSP1333-20130426/96666_1 /TAXON_ID=418940 /ORGANISM="Scyphosphaera apsteinii, Strain RCC1455" /LENGTH=73 /DNA_ID=CAMNT_0007350031 /DNA_START=140 /DNA_END=357 /DNA_ORIENTATION=-